MVFHKLPALRARIVIRTLEKAGFVKDRQKGSHAIMINHSAKKRTVVPIHSGETIYKSLLVDIIHQAGMDVDKFLELL